MIKTIMLFAAGLGSRMRHLTENTPKCLLPILGKPILHYTLELCKTYPFEKIIINTHYFSNKIQDKLEEFKKQHPGFPPIVTVYEEELLETGGAIKNTVDIIGLDPIFTLNTDVIIKASDNIFTALQKRWDTNFMDFLLLMQPIENAIGYKGRGDFDLSKEGRLIRPIDKNNFDYMYTGLQILKPREVRLNPSKVFSLKDYYFASNKVFGTVANNMRWYHATRPEDIAEIEHHIIANNNE